MSIQIAQDFEYQGDDWWKWSVWIAGSQKDLDAIQSVEYKLHPSFANPVRIVEDRASQFKLKTRGWGVFPIRARVIHKNGAVVRLSHQLVLKYADGTPTEE